MKFRISLVFILLFFLLEAFSQSMTCMSYNIRYDNPEDGENNWGKRKNEVAKLILFYQPDFLGTQEALIHQLTYLDSQLSGYDRIGVGRENGKEKGEFAAIFYNTNKFDLLQKATFWLSESPEKISIGWDAALERICTYGKFRNKKTKEDIYVFNAHFDHQGSLARVMSAKLIIEKIKKLANGTSKVVLMGDFNSLPNTQVIKIFRRFFDSDEVFGKSLLYGPEGTFNDFKINSSLENRLDYIFIKNAKIMKYRHIDDKRKSGFLWVSDHLPVFTQIKE